MYVFGVPAIEPSSTDVSDKEEVQGELRASQTPNVIYYLCLNRIYAENAYVGAIVPVKLASPVKVFGVSAL